MKEQIYECCRELRLSSSFAENALTIEASTNQAYLTTLLQKEVKYRMEKRKNLYLKQAGFDVIKTFEGYEFDGIEIPSALTIDLIEQADFLNRTENLILYGRSGSGKSHMATAIGIEACMQGKKVKFYKTATLVNELVAAKADGTLLPFMKKLSKVQMLICDEWGYIPFDAEGSQLLFQVIADCYEKRSLIITTNLEFSKWNGIFYDEKLTNALIDRLVHHSHLLVFNRQSKRLEESLIQQQIN